MVAKWLVKDGLWISISSVSCMHVDQAAAPLLTPLIKGLQQHPFKIISSIFYWVAVKELKLHDHNGDI